MEKASCQWWYKGVLKEAFHERAEVDDTPDAHMQLWKRKEICFELLDSYLMLEKELCFQSRKSFLLIVNLFTWLLQMTCMILQFWSFECKWNKSSKLTTPVVFIYNSKILFRTPENDNKSSLE